MEPYLYHSPISVHLRILRSRTGVVVIFVLWKKAIHQIGFLPSEFKTAHYHTVLLENTGIDSSEADFGYLAIVFRVRSAIRDNSTSNDGYSEAILFWRWGVAGRRNHCYTRSPFSFWSHCNCHYYLQFPYPTKTENIRVSHLFSWSVDNWSSFRSTLISAQMRKTQQALLKALIVQVGQIEKNHEMLIVYSDGYPHHLLLHSTWKRIRRSISRNQYGRNLRWSHDYVLCYLSGNRLHHHAILCEKVRGGNRTQAYIP